MENKKSTLSDKDIIAKYQGKRVRIDGYIYVVSVDITNQIEVELRPLSPKADTASNRTNRDDYKYQGAGGIYQHATDKACAIAEEIEENLPVDFEQEVSS